MAASAGDDRKKDRDSVWFVGVKRTLDLFLILLTAVVWLPLLAIVALTVRLGLGRPVFFFF